MSLAIRAAGTILQYLSETQAAGLKLLTGLSTYNLSEFMTLDAATRRNLELSETLRSGSVKGSLLDILDHTVTPMGKRLMLQWVNKPLLDVDRIQRRQAGVDFFFQDGLLRAELRAALKPLGDLERLVNRVLGGSALPRDLVSMRETLTRLPLVRGLLPFENETQSNQAEEDTPKPGNALTDILKDFDLCEDDLQLLQSALAENPPATLNTSGVIRSAYSAELDGVVERSKHAREWIANLESAERKRTGIKSLKVGYNKVFGYYIEITRARLHSQADPRERRALHHTRDEGIRDARPECRRTHP